MWALYAQKEVPLIISSMFGWPVFVNSWDALVRKIKRILLQAKRQLDSNESNDGVVKETHIFKSFLLKSKVMAATQLSLWHLRSFIDWLNIGLGEILPKMIEFIGNWISLDTGQHFKLQSSSLSFNLIPSWHNNNFFYALNFFFYECLGV